MTRVIDKQTNLFIRDDFTFDELTEIGLDVEPAQGFYHPKWDFITETWAEGLTVEEIEAIKSSVTTIPSDMERLQAVESALLEMMGVVL
ncbi:hypothetical protein [Parasporobacterium paucivorans]|uniref:Uncharacterized protein n=1 Tax=Parasporobacterium paucivorans DSM 15970 TaxID=1122934 RepID=A0A1M6B0L1_9FIRM|nr:hypothetical protein [Parasporobacterium paucivorans]SHI42108.1 hypothetical protein SAMN02745691_00226 [Parasporobacterium paucivorans DSM 15970]